MNTPRFEEYLLQHIREVTAKTYCKRLRILSKLGDLDDAERMKTLIRTRSVSEAMKELYARAPARIFDTDKQDFRAR